MKKRNKNSLPILDSDQDFLAVFENMAETGLDQENKRQDPSKKCLRNTLSDEQSDTIHSTDDIPPEDFEQLLAESFEKEKETSFKRPGPMPLKRRLKRYPPVELVLDLHGYNAIGAQIKTRSFIHSCKHQGFFTVKIIVGKGRHSDFGPVLPDVVEDEVKEMKKQGLVLWFEWEKKIKSNSGALIVYLKQFERFE